MQENTDENHIAHAEDIKLYLLNHGIAAERKSIYSDISILIDFGYDIIKSNGSGGGYFLASRDFELAELRLLSDAVQAANFISAKKTKQLLNKIFTLTSAEQAKKSNLRFMLIIGRNVKMKSCIIQLISLTVL